jgi:hypothetical protein
MRYILVIANRRFFFIFFGKMAYKNQDGVRISFLVKNRQNGQFYFRNVNFSGFKVLVRMKKIKLKCNEAKFSKFSLNSMKILLQIP